MSEKGYVYFMTNANNKALYIGVTSDLTKRVLEHKHHKYEGFTDKYNWYIAFGWRKLKFIKNIFTYLVSFFLLYRNCVW